MPLADYFIMMGIGGLFTILGLVSIVWGRIRKKRCNDSLLTRTDVRSYLEGEFEPEFESLKIGGWIAIAIGLVLLAMGGGFWLWG